MAGLNVSVADSDGKGRGLFAEVDFNEGDVIFTEKPIVSCQFSWNKCYKYEACEYCMKSIETSEKMCQRLCQDDGIVLPHSECCEVDETAHVTCENCNVKYCCKNCKENALKQYHKILCLGEQNEIKYGLITLEETWKQMHYPPETASVMIIAKMLALVKQSSKKDEIINKLTNFCHKTKNEDEKIVHKLLGEKFIDQIENLRLQLKNILFEEPLSEWFTENGFRSLLALLGTNQQGIGSSSLSTWVKNCDNLELSEERRTELDEFIDKLYEKMDEVSGQFLNCEGVGLYSLQSCCNHSCDPNAEIAFEHGDNTITSRAINSIPSGSEIFISYLGECGVNRSRHSRQKDLAENYLFHCQCPKCSDQADDPDLTSEEESDMET